MIQLDLWLCEECPYAETQALHNRRTVDEDNTEPDELAGPATTDHQTRNMTAELDGLRGIVEGTPAPTFDGFITHRIAEPNTTGVITNIE